MIIGIIALAFGSSNNSNYQTRFARVIISIIVSLGCLITLHYVISGKGDILLVPEQKIEGIEFTSSQKSYEAN